MYMTHVNAPNMTKCTHLSKNGTSLSSGTSGTGMVQSTAITRERKIVSLYFIFPSLVWVFDHEFVVVVIVACDFFA